MFWIINMFTHPSFDLLLPKLFCLSCCLKALSSAFTANYWIELSDAGIASIRTVLISELANILSNTFLFTINLLAAYGLSSFRTSVSYGEVIWAISAPMWLFIARRFIFHTEDLLLSVIYGLILLAYLGKTCSLEQLPQFISREEIASACFIACNKNPCIVPDYVINILKPLIIKDIMTWKTPFATNDMVKNFRAFVQIGILGSVIKNAESNDWILRVKQTYRNGLNETELRVLLKAKFIYKFLFN